ncbi:hypothetical protein CQ052_03900 [Ochrobactrum sp. MYb15]|nr:hypothetical protein CQZ90_04990 [Ochrobactrum sp. MYb19]PRA62813.1 hypothetical protein CQ053_18375 [Ochrobactrum sp. MYb18]PRA76534.1 hypothetical protein CQ049_03900 [Brucella thiophenivorans]PRA93835.1 hypothetical protein CQ051_04990 [Ochrobactrum sp. MYb14]PRA98541.1 hypothetical protein CQ052_03900 [Ochrobactrum sp. MYb15]
MDCLLSVFGIFAGRKVKVVAHQFFRPVNRCIYCGGSNGKLTDEHIVPFSLGGTIVLPKASCEDCQNRINVFETSISTQTYISFRSAQRFPSRTKSLLDSIPVIFRVGQTETRREIPIDDAPVSYTIPHFSLPPYVPGSTGNSPVVLHMHEADQQKWNRLFRTYFPKAETATVHSDGMRIEYFVRLMFKIAYGFAWLVDPDCAFRWHGREKILHGNFPRFPRFEDIFSVRTSRLEGEFFSVTTFTEIGSGECELYCQVEILSGDTVPTYVCRLGPTQIRHPFGLEFRPSADISDLGGMQLRLADASHLR